jgi:RNA polymerase sigma-70 factor (ECF subfamily)
VGSVDLDPDSAEWVRSLRAAGPDRAAALARLHELLLRIARGELARRAGRHGLHGPELDDVAHQAAADALLAVTGKLDQFRGESRFTTWAFRFVVLEVSHKLGRHFWRRPGVTVAAEDWERLPDAFGFQPEQEAEWRDLVDALHRAVDTELTEHQRMLFVATVLDGVPLDALVDRLGTTRNAIYKTVFDARRKLRAHLVANGYLTDDVARHR